MEKDKSQQYLFPRTKEDIFRKWNNQFDQTLYHKILETIAYIFKTHKLCLIQRVIEQKQSSECKKKLPLTFPNKKENKEM